MSTPHPQSRLSLIALNENLRKEQLYRHQVMSALPERIQRDALFDLIEEMKAKCSLSYPAWEAQCECEHINVIRACGDVICEYCNQPYRKHPHHPELWESVAYGNGRHYWAHVLCDGRVVKL